VGSDFGWIVRRGGDEREGEKSENELLHARDCSGAGVARHDPWRPLPLWGADVSSARLSRLHERTRRPLSTSRPYCYGLTRCTVARVASLSVRSNSAAGTGWL